MEHRGNHLLVVAATEEGEDFPFPPGQLFIIELMIKSLALSLDEG